MQVRSEIDSVVAAGSLHESGRPPRTIPRGRLCAEYRCDTRLSVYNDSDYSALHEQPLAPRGVVRRSPDGPRVAEVTAGSGAGRAATPL
jgi:hypothetical protein